MAGEEAKQSKEKLDFKDVENGPLSQANRQCRDVLCCILFLANLIAMGYCAIQGYATGDTNRIWRATDSNGNVCGQKNSPTQNYPYSYFYAPLNDTSLRMCVQQCPSAMVSPNLPTFYNLPAGLSSYTAWIYIDLATGYYSVTPTGGVQFNLIYDSQAFMSRICIPSTKVLEVVLKDVVSKLASVANSGTFSNFIMDLRENWEFLLAGFGVAVVFSFIWMFSLRCLAGCIVWTSLIGMLFSLIGLGVVFIYYSGKIAGFVPEQYVGYMGLPTASQNANYDIYAYITWGIAGLFLIVLLCCCSRIRLAVAVCKSAGKFVASVCTVVLVPIWQTILVITLWAPAIVAIVYLASAASYVPKNSGAQWDVFTSIQNYGDQKLVYMYYFIFGILWSNALLQAMGIFVIASACAMWYYSHGPGQELDSPILRGYKMSFKYHFGSLAFGSLILAIVQFMQLIVEAFKKQAESTGADKNKCFEYVINCIRCCLACVERIVQFINKTAYIQIAIRGKNFCMAAYDGFNLVWSNPIRFGVVTGVGEILMFLGKIIISVGTALFFYALIVKVDSIAKTVFEPILLVVIIAIISYAIATLFMAVYSIAMDTLLACFIVDEQNQKAKGGKAPLYAPEELAELIDRDE